MGKTFKYFIIYKPFGVVSQFKREKKRHGVLGDLHDFPTDVYPVGRLDKDSEGLLLLTNDGKLTFRLLKPEFRHNRSYLVQVDGDISEKAIEKLNNRVEISVNKKKYLTLPAKAEKLDNPPDLPERIPPVRYRKNIPTSWIRLTLQEGKYRQVRKMTAAVGFPTLRLVREKIEGLSLQGLKPGDVQEMKRVEVYSKVKVSLNQHHLKARKN